MIKGLAADDGRYAIVNASEDQLCKFFAAMASGEIRRADGKRYRSTADYVKVFKSFWHWHMKVMRKQGVHILDICVDLDTRAPKPKWVYLTEQDVARLARAAAPKYRLLIQFLFDSGIRAPTELVNIRVQDLLEDCTRLRIRDETSKTFGRTISLVLSSSCIKHYVDDRHLDPTDQLFPINPTVANRYLRRLGERVLGEAVSPAGERYSRLTLYDFRHSSACYWLPRYKSESGLKYRFGWRRSEMIHYYTELLGMRDTIAPDDIHLPDTRTELERRLATVEAEKRVAEERITAMHSQIQVALQRIERLSTNLTEAPRQHMVHR